VTNRLSAYREALEPLTETNTLWPLFGAGFENLGREGEPVEAPMLRCGPDELLVRHDACGLCFSDIKVVRAGQEHPRIYRDMAADPVVLGHEVVMTVVEVGGNLRDEYRVGDRHIIQADIFVDGVGYAYGYEIQGGLSRYNIIDRRILDGDHGCYLLPVMPSTGYAEAALTEPWACVIAAYGLSYRTGLKPGGTAWIIGSAPPPNAHFSFGGGLDEDSHPDRLLLTDVPAGFDGWLRERAVSLGIEVTDVEDISRPSTGGVDDIILLGAGAGIIEAVSPHLADFGVLAVVDEQPLRERVGIDAGRIHYNRWLYIGGAGPDIAAIYSSVPARSELKPGGSALFVGAGGPMGRMHLQRAIQLSGGPSSIVCTDISGPRLREIRDSIGEEALSAGIEFTCLNPEEKESYERGIDPFRETGFDDIVVLAQVPSLIEEAAGLLAPGGVLNVFAGVARGTMVSIDLSDIWMTDIRIIGHSASTIEDLRLMLDQAESGELSPGRSVAAIGSLSAAREGLMAVAEARFPGKVVIYPQIKEMPLTPVAGLREKLPRVYRKLGSGQEWTTEAEEEFLREMLP